jgi:hypothetical protein
VFLLFGPWATLPVFSVLALAVDRLIVLAMDLYAQMSHPLPDLSRREFWNELPYLPGGLPPAFGTILHPHDQNLVYLRQPPENFAFLLALGIETVFHKQISLHIVCLHSRVYIPSPERRADDRDQSKQNNSFCKQQLFSGLPASADGGVLPTANTFENLTALHLLEAD